MKSKHEKIAIITTIRRQFDLHKKKVTSNYVNSHSLQCIKRNEKK